MDVKLTHLRNRLARIEVDHNGQEFNDVIAMSVERDLLKRTLARYLELAQSALGLDGAGRTRLAEKIAVAIAGPSAAEQPEEIVFVDSIDDTAPLLIGGRRG